MTQPNYTIFVYRYFYEREREMREWREKKKERERERHNLRDIQTDSKNMVSHVEKK